MLETSTIHSWVTKYIHFWLTLEVTIHYILRRHDLLNNTRQTLLPKSAEYTVLQYQLPQRFYIVLTSRNTSALCTYDYRQPEAIIYHQSRLYITSLANTLARAFHLSTAIYIICAPQASLYSCANHESEVYTMDQCEYQLEARIYNKNSAKPFSHG